MISTSGGVYTNASGSALARAHSRSKAARSSGVMALIFYEDLLGARANLQAVFDEKFARPSGKHSGSVTGQRDADVAESIGEALVPLAAHHLVEIEPEEAEDGRR